LQSDTKLATSVYASTTNQATCCGGAPPGVPATLSAFDDLNFLYQKVAIPNMLLAAMHHYSIRSHQSAKTGRALEDDQPSLQFRILIAVSKVKFDVDKQT